MVQFSWKDINYDCSELGVVVLSVARQGVAVEIEVIEKCLEENQELEVECEEEEFTIYLTWWELSTIHKEYTQYWKEEEN